MSKVKNPDHLHNGFLVMNEFGEYFAGMMYGHIVFSSSQKDAKPLYDLHKVQKMKHFLKTEELIHEYIK